VAASGPALVAGDVTVGDIYNVLPFDNTLVVVELMGMDIIDALEHSVRLWPEQSGGFPAGIRHLLRVRTRCTARWTCNQR